MKPLALDELASIVGGVASSECGLEPITGFALDSRQAKEGDLFLAVRGERVDGHDFVAAALEAGSVGALVERPVVGPYVLVPSLVGALAALAAHFRASFQGPVVAVTGSAGKTTTKELVAAALGPLGPVLKTEGNRNSEYTAPLLWTELADDTKSVVLEMGMRGYGQIEHLASFSKPTIGIVTNVGVSHIEFVGSRNGVAQAKAELLLALPKDGSAILWAEDDYVEYLRGQSKAAVATFGFSKGADCRVEVYEVADWSSCTISGVCFGEPFEAVLGAVGRHVALDAAAAILAAARVGVSPSQSGPALSSAEFPPLRMEVIEHEGATIVLDAYNASPPSVIAALYTQRDIPCSGRRMAVLGEMKELGSYAEQGYREVGEAVVGAGVDLLAVVGEGARPIADWAETAGMDGSRVLQLESVQAVSSFLRTLNRGDTVLIKGSRSVGLEKSVDFIREPVA